VLAKLIQQPALALLAAASVTPPQPFQFVVSFRDSLHVHHYLFGVFFP